MKTHSSHSLSARATLSALLMLIGIGILCALPYVGHAQTSTFPGATPSSGTINPDGTGTTDNWVGTTVSPGGNTAESTCMDNSAVLGCEVYTLTVGGTQSQWAGKKIQVLLSWSTVANEYDIYIHQGSESGTVVTSAIQGPGLTNQVAYIDPSTTGVGTYTVHVAYDTTPASATDEYHGAVTVVSSSGSGSGTPVAAPVDTAGPVGYENFEAPGVLTQGTSTSSGAVTVEYLGRNAGEPSIGANFKSGVINFQSDLQTLFVSFDDSCNLSNPKATWVNRRAPTSVFIDSDPIGFTDRTTGRVFASELTLLSPDTSKISYTDDDGTTWIPANQAQGIASAVDHQTIGGGPYHSPIPTPPAPLYPNAVYYCSQDIATAFCARSDDGGTTFGTQTPLYALTQCGGLHGHVKVAPDGTVYVPNRGCGSNTAVVVSTDNGLTWTIQPVQNGSVTNTAASDDPAVGIDAGGKVYCLFAMGGTYAGIGVSSDQGATWKNIYDLAANVGVKNVAFPAAVGGDAGRAAVAFYGSTTGPSDPGASSADQFPGVWHLYVAHTFDGGNHWTTTDVTPNLPMQRMGLLRGGGGPVDRNLLDFFDITMDRDGRALVGYVNGCSGGPCSQAASTATGNAYTTTASIARQSSGRRLLAADDPTSSTSAPGMPFVTAKRVGPVVTLAWNQADTGNLPITGYDIYRGTTSGGETLYASIGNATGFTDGNATDPTLTYYYRVVAKNSSNLPACGNNEIAVPYIGDTCSGLILHRNLPSHPEATGNGATGVPSSPTPTPSPTAAPDPNPQYLIDYIAVGEPPDHPGDLMFKMKVVNLNTPGLNKPPPNSRWRIVWDWVGTAANANADEQEYVGMTTDQNSNATFEYGTVATTSVVVLGVPTENMKGAADTGSGYDLDGTITIYVPKANVGNPQVGDLLGAVNGRTFSEPGPAERSTLLIDHTFVKGNTDSSYPPATYTIVGNNACAAANIVPVSAVSRKQHGSAGTFDIDLPLLGNPGIEDRTGGPSKNYQVVVTFDVPVSITGATVTPGSGGTGSVSSYSASNTTVTVNLTNVSNAQTLHVNLLNVKNGSQVNNVSIPMGVLIGDTTADRTVNSADISQTKARSGQAVGLTNYRNDVTVDGNINSADISLVKSKSGTALP